MSLKQSLRLSLVILTLSLGSAVYALDTTCESVYNAPPIKGLLSQANTELMDNTYNCGSVCAINMIQLIKNIWGEKPIAKPAQLLNRLYSDIPETRTGLSPAGLDRLLSLMIKEHLPHKDIKYSILSLEGGEMEKSEHITMVKKTTIDDLVTDAHTFKIVLYLVLDGNGQQVAGHYVIIKNTFKVSDHMNLSIIDPTYPEKSFHMEAENMTINQQIKAILVKPVEEELNQIYEQSFGQKYKVVIQSIFTLNIK